MKTVILDPGHGGADSGGYAGGVTEKSIVLDHGLRVRKILSGYDCRVLMTRENDEFLTLSERRQFANRNNSDCFVSIHTNAYRLESSKGFEAFTTPGATRSDPLCSIWMRRYENSFGDRKPRKDTSDGDADKEANFAVLKCKGPAMLLELGFITNTEEREWMMREDIRQRQALVTAHSIVEFLGLKPNSVQSPTPPPQVHENPNQDAILTRLSEIRGLLSEIEDLA